MVRRNVHVNPMPPKGNGVSPSDTKLKFSDRLKAYLASNTEKITESSLESTDDPYQFSDNEVNNASKKCAEKIRENVKKVYVLNGGTTEKTSAHGRESGHGKTMSRLQAQIARNKVTVKHSRCSPDPKESGKDTKRSIIGELTLPFADSNNTFKCIV